MRAITFDIETKSVGAPMRGHLDVMKMEITVVGIHDSESGELKAYTKEELPQLWPILESADMLIGYNSNSFDIPLLNRYYPGDLTRIKSLDLLVEVYKALGRRLRLQTLAEATLNASKSGDGLKAMEWWDQGLYEKVKEYCLMDVKLTRDLYDYALKNGSLKYKDFNQKKDIKLDTRDWERVPDAPALTHTLPF